MRLRVSAPNSDLTQSDLDGIEHDLEKIDRRLQDFKEEVTAHVRIKSGNDIPEHHVMVELDYGRNHLLAKAEGADVGQAVRAARDELLRQINDRTRRGHSSFAKRSSGRTH
jgi:ribosome-associated translation inhibitor RaiA